jgi:hypothetical protein
MGVFLTLISIVGSIIVLGLAALGAIRLVIVGRASGVQTDLRYRTRQAEQDIVDIGRRAQAAILEAALSRAWRNRTEHRDGEL